MLMPSAAPAIRAAPKEVASITDGRTINVKTNEIKNNYQFYNTYGKYKSAIKKADTSTNYIE
jgi:hypothetical protein